MQISNLLPTNSIASDLGLSPQTPKSNARPATPQDSVEISSQASHFSQIQAAYDAGTYNVSPSQIANSIMNYATAR